MKMLKALLIIFTFLYTFDSSAHSAPLPSPPKAPHNVLQNNVKKAPQRMSLRDMYNKLKATKPKQYLDAHNAFRLKMGMPPLQWDAKLEAYSRVYASNLAKDCRVLKHSNGPYGENIAWELYGEFNPAQAVKRFTDEQVNFDLRNSVCNCPPISSKCKCGHFTQVIWKTTKRVGCAEAACSGERGKLVVCSYDPRGNAPGQNPLRPLI